MIKKRKIGAGESAFIIAEVAQAHDGSLGLAHAYIDSIANTGADAVKFQTHIADAESTPREKFRVNTFPQDESRYDYWKRMEFTAEQWAGLAKHAHDKGLIFLSTPFSMEAVDLLERLNAPAWKIGSGEIGNTPLLQKVARTGKPVLLSSGMSPWSEMDDAVNCIRQEGGAVAIFQCTSSYPCPPEQLGLNVIHELRDRFKCPVGLSDHSGSIYAGLAAITLGANMVEVHAVISKELFGPDVYSSVTTSELAKLVDGIRFIESALAHPLRKDDEAQARNEMRRLFGKSLVAACDLPKGHLLSETDIKLKKPGTGIPAKRFNEVIGRTIKKAYAFNEAFEEKDFE